MACSNKKYNPKQYGMINLWTKMFTDWESRIIAEYQPSVAEDIIKNIKAGTFDQSYGKYDAKRILSKKDPLTNALDIKNLKAHYVTVGPSKTDGDFNKMKAAFLKKLISNVLLDSNLKRIETDYITSNGVTQLNENLYNFKMDLVEELWNKLFPGRELNRFYSSDENFTKLLSEVISEYESRRLSDSSLDENWDSYFQLKFFDQLISDFDGFVELKPEYVNNSYKSNDMYVAVKPYVAYDTSFNPNEFASAEQYASEVLKTLLDYFKEVELNGVPGPNAITFKGFNYAVTRLIEWVRNQSSESLRAELDRGNNTNWGFLIDSYLADKGAENKEVTKKLKGLRAILVNKNLDSTIKEMLNEQKERVVRYQFEVYRVMYDPKLKRNVIVSTRLEDTIADRQKGSIARSIRTRVNHFRKYPSEFESLLKDNNISYNSATNTLTFHGYQKQGHDINIKIIPDSERTYRFEIDGYNASDINDSKIKTLVQNLLQIQISDNYDDIFNHPNFNTSTLWGTFGDAIMMTIGASFTGDKELSDYSFRYGGNELEIKGVSYYDLRIPAAFIALQNGVAQTTILQNGLGNDLPVYQQISAIHKAQELLRNGKKNYEGLRGNIHGKNAVSPKVRNTTFDDNILNPNYLGYSPIGSVVVRADFDYNGSNKNSAQMNFNELTHLSIIKSFWENLNKRDRSILLQTTCLSDKHTHFMVEFLTDRILLYNGQKLSDILMNLGSANKSISAPAETVIENEIKSRFSKKTKVQVVNLLNRYNLALNLKAVATIDESFESLKLKLDALNEQLNTVQESKLLELCRKAGVDTYREADLIKLGGKYYVNETLYSNFLTYCDDNKTRFSNKIKSQKMAHARMLAESRFVLDGRLDPSLNRAFNSFRKANPQDYSKWYDPANNSMKAFRVVDSNGNEIEVDYENLDLTFDSSKYTVQLNPILNSHFYADVLLSNSFNDIVFGDDIGLENKYLKEANARLEQLPIEIANLEKAIKIASGKEKIELQNELKLKQQELSNLDYNSEEFRTVSEASRLTGHYKRTVHGGATYTPLLQNLKYGVAPKVKIAVIDDVDVFPMPITGQRKFTSQDGAGWVSAYFSRMANRSYVDGAVGKNKKTIFSYVDPETGILCLIKWAEYEITNAIRRDSPLDSEHNSYEEAFRKMHNMKLPISVFKNFDISKYYKLQGNAIPGVTRIDPIYKKDISTGKHYKLVNVSNQGNAVTTTWQEVDVYRNEIGDTFEEGPVFVESIYDIDQVFGGAFVEDINDNGVLDWSEAQNDIVFQMICDEGWKNYFIGVAVNASSVKSGMRNNNSSDVFKKGFNRKNGKVVDTSQEELNYFEMSTRTGGAQMNADHILSEAEVTEMSQMISALIQAGNKTKTVDKIYRFIGRVAKDALGELSDMVDDPNKELELYQWLGEAVSYAFKTGSGDTLGLAGAFIARANKNFQQNGLKTRIPYSANTVKGIFESTITSYINKNGIHRKFPGGGFVQNPNHDVKLRYHYNGVSYSYTEFADKIIELNKLHGWNVSVEQALTDDSFYIDEITGKIKFNNPYIQELNNTHDLDVGDTVLIYDPNTNTVKSEALTDFKKYDKYRNLSENVVGVWTCRPKNLLGSRHFFEVNGQKYSLYDLDHQRALMYTSILLDPKKFGTLDAAALMFLNDYSIKYNISVDINDKNSIRELSAFAIHNLKQDLKKLSKIQETGQGVFESQLAFGTDGSVVIKNIRMSASQGLIGIADAKAFGITSSRDLDDIRRDAYRFFKKQVINRTRLLPGNKVAPDKYDAVLYGNDGEPTLLIIGELHDNKSILDGMVPDPSFRIGEDGKIYNGEDELGNSIGKRFYTYVGKDGVQYKVLYVHSLNDYNKFNSENNLYSNIVYNFTPENFKELRDVLYGDSKLGLVDLMKREKARQSREIDILAKQRVSSWESYKKGIGTRIPAQSMQSFTAIDIVGFTDESQTNIYVSTTLADLQGSDYDIDKLYFMRYGVDENGRIVTFSNLDRHFDAEKVLDLPMPSKRKFKVHVLTNESRSLADQFGEYDKSAFIEFGKGGISTINDILSQDKDIIYISQSILDSNRWYEDSLDKYTDARPEQMNAEKLEYLLNLHENSKRNKKDTSIALRNTVVRGILDVLHDPSTQFNLQIPISMKEQQDAASLSTLAKKERYLTNFNPSAKIMMQIQNMVGRDVIGIGAASLKAFFATSTYFNLQSERIAELLKEPESSERNVKIWNCIKSVCFNAKFGDRGLVTLANINWDAALDAVKNIEFIDVVDDTTNVNDHLKNYIDNGKLRIRDLIEHLEQASNGDWRSPIDAAYSLSGLISAATDNAKELILSKINATSKFADIYTYLLTTGESFKSIAKFMISPEFGVVATFAEGNVMDPKTKWFDLERSLKFVLDEETLPNIDNEIFMWVLTNVKNDNFISQLIYKNRNQMDEKWVNAFNNEVYNCGRTADDVFKWITKVVNNAKTSENEFTAEYKALVAFVYKTLRNDPNALNKLLDYLRLKIASSSNVNDVEDEDIEYDPDQIDEEYYGEAGDEEETTKHYSFNYSSLKKEDWQDVYTYVKMYLKPKNQMLRGISDFSNIKKLKNDIIPALKEQRILSKILGINQGINTKDFDEYKWIRDIESFINERYINSESLSTYLQNKKLEIEQFDFIKFFTDNAYAVRQIDQYEQVKSTYNILDIITNVSQFKAMLELSVLNRKLIEKAYVLKVERKLAQRVLETDKRIKNGLSLGLTQKFNDKEYQVLKNFTQDILTINWIKTLADVTIKVPIGQKYYDNGELLDHNYGEREKSLNDADSMATFKWLMEHYIIPKIKELYKGNSFTDALQESYKIDKDVNEAVFFYTLPIDLRNADENSKTEEMYNLYLSGFNSIWKDVVPEDWGIGEWTIGDLFYLYNLYVHKDGFGQNALTRLFDNVVLSDNNSTLLYRYYEYLAKLDSGTESIDDLENLSNDIISELRFSLAKQNSAGTKFRVRFNPATAKEGATYELLSDSYKAYEKIPVNTLNKSDYLFGFTMQYNPAKITVTQTVAKELAALDKRRRAVVGKEVMTAVMNELQRIFGDRIKMIAINNEWFKNAPEKFKNDRTMNAKGFIRNGVIYINVDKANAGTPVHEIMHLILATLKYSDKVEERNLYYGIMHSIKAEVKSGNEYWSKYWDQVEKKYEGYVVGSDFEEEVFTNAIEDLFATGFYKNIGVQSANGSVNRTLSEFLEMVSQSVSKLFVLPHTQKGASILNMSLGQLVVDLSSKLFDASSNILITTNVPINQKLSALKRKLFIEWDEDRKDDYLTFNGDC